MGELRKDYILNRFVYISEVRAKRPHQFQDSKQPKDVFDFFAPGNEYTTPYERGRIENADGSWKMRWFENKFPAVKPEGQAEIKTDNEFFTFSAAYGHHEVFVETESDKQLWDFSKEELKQVFEVYKERINHLEKEPNIKYVQVFKNHGDQAGTSILHSHSQIIASNLIPSDVQDKIDAAKRYPSCPYCRIIDIEKGSYRRCFENEHFVAFTPYASRFNYEIWVFSKEHKKTLNECNLDALADIMKNILNKLKEINCAYNWYVYYAPNQTDLHFHIAIMPRIQKLGGFELGSGMVINTVSPEQAAAFYRNENY